MRKKQPYRAVRVKDVDRKTLEVRLACGSIHVGIDVAKQEALVVVRDSAGQFERPWKVRLPGEIHELVALLQALGERHPLVVAMEPTGSYGHALHQALSDAAIVVHRVRTQATQEYAEMFDGVPSNHDGKDAAMLAELCALGKSWPWPWEVLSEADAELKSLVLWLDAQQTTKLKWIGRLEGLVSCYWPEASRLLDLTSQTLLRALREYGDPRALAADPEASAKLSSWGGHFLKAEKIAALLESARRTTGLRMTAAEVKYLKRVAQATWEADAAVTAAERELQEAAKQDATIQRMAPIVGSNTACVLAVTLGKPQAYHCGEAYRKALGLNLKERSSGQQRGGVHISKRGPSLARRWLFFAALREIKQGSAKTWYERQKAKDQDRGMGAVVAVMRRLALAIYAVVRDGSSYSPARMFGPHPVPTSIPSANE